MKIIDDIKQRVAKISLQKELKNQKRVIAFNNFESATTVGFIFDANDREKFQFAKEFMDFVEKQNNRIFGIAYALKSEQIAYFPYRNGVDYFGLNEINWYGIPVNPVIKDFLKRNFDILIDLTLSDIFATEYLFSLSNAKFKIVNSGIKARYADFIIEVKNSEKIDNYINQIKHYLKAVHGKQG